MYDGNSPRGWTLLTGRDDKVNWTFTGGLISGRNGSAKNTILGPHYKEAYFWQNYTFTLKIRVVSGNCQVGARCNVNDQRNLSGATFQVPAGKWVEMKVVANGDQAVATADGQQAGAINTHYPTGYPAIFLMPNSQVEIKDVTMELKSNRK